MEMPYPDHSKWQIIYSNDGIQHSGIKGQSWFTRRYQNPDGTYTKEGLERKRAAYQAGVKLRKKVDEYGAKRKAKKQEKAERKQKEQELQRFKDATGNSGKASDYNKARERVKDMSDAEIRSAIARMRLEQEYLSLFKPQGSNNQNQNPNKKSSEAGKKFVKSILGVGTSLVSALADAGATAIKESFKSAFKDDGDEPKKADRYDQMKKETQQWNTKKAYNQAMKEKNAYIREQVRAKHPLKENYKVKRGKKRPPSGSLLV